MIKLHNPNIQSAEGLVEVYVVEVGAVEILILGKPDYSCFRYFKPSGTTKDTLIQDQGQLYLNSPYRINLGALRSIDYSTISIVLLSDFKAYFIVPYILRQKKLPILLTQPMYEFGKIHSTTFLEQMMSQNRFCEEINFMDENEAFDRMEQEHDINLEEFVELYEAHELDLLNLHAHTLNPGQIHRFGELQITPFSSGASIAECLWSITSKANSNQYVVMLNGSLETWRHCKEIEVERIKNASYLILGRNLIAIQPQVNTNPHSHITDFVSSIEKQLRSGSNVHLKSDSSIHIIDLIEILNYHIGNVYKQLIILDSNFPNYLKYANSFVQYLNPIRSNNIHNEPPEYPFSHIDKLVTKGLLSSGSILQIAIKQKVPSKQILLRYKPAVLIHPTQFEFINICSEKSKIPTPDSRIKPSELDNWINKVSPRTTLCFQKGTKYYTQQKSLTLQPFSYSSFPFSRPINIFQQYYLKNGLATEQGEKRYRVVPKDWSGKLFKKLMEYNVESEATATTLETETSKLTLQNHTFHLTSLSISELQLIYKALGTI